MDWLDVLPDARKRTTPDMTGAVARGIETPFEGAAAPAPGAATAAATTDVNNDDDDALSEADERGPKKIIVRQGAAQGAKPP
jgi:hypothetical protein